jgi:hypothetical protein
VVESVIKREIRIADAGVDAVATVDVPTATVTGQESES